MDFTPKQLPTNLEAEQAVLASILVNNRNLERVSEFLRAEHFTHPAHKEIYRLMERQFAAGFPVDLITIKNYLEQQGILESVGGTDYLAELSGAGATVINMDAYGRIVYDNAMRRELIDIGQNITDAAFVEDLDNPIPNQISAAEQKLFDLATSGETVDKGPADLRTSLHAALVDAETAFKADGKLSGLTTGFSGLDKSISGLHNSDLIIIAGRPAMGKTTLGMNIAFNAASAIRFGTANKKFSGAVIFFSLEMSAPQLGARILSSIAEVPSTSLRNGDLKESDFTHLATVSDQVSKNPLFIDDTPGMSVPMMRTRARRIKRKHGLSLIVIDYLQLMQAAGGRRSDNRVNELSEITRGLKMLAKDLDVPIIALSQLSRMVEGEHRKGNMHRPQLSDLRESGSIEQDADLVMFTYREEYYVKQQDPDLPVTSTRQKAYENKSAPDSTDRLTWGKYLKQIENQAEVIIGKNRHGRPETIHLLFEGDFSRFKDNDSFKKDYANRQFDDAPPAPEPVPHAPEPDLTDVPDDI